MARKSRKENAVSAIPQSRENKIYRAAAYIRLSSDDKRKRGDSLETQKNIIERYVTDKADIQLAEIYSDNNATGTNFERPGFQKMLADAESGKINCIIVKDLSRFGRNAIDAGYYLEKYLPSLNVRFIAVTDDYDSLTSDGGIMLPLKNMIAESYALDISRKLRAVHRQNISDGKYIGRLAPYGYDKSPADCHKLVVDPEASEIVREIFLWSAEGAVPREIARRLNGMGITSPSKRVNAKGLSVNSHDNEAVFWSERTIKKILSDRVYLGETVQGKSRTVNHRHINAPSSEWVYVPGTHEAIVSAELFESVQAILADRTEHDKSVRSAEIPFTPNIFHNTIFCAHCGFAMHRNRNNKTGGYWFRCQSQWRYDKDACTVVSAREDDVLEAVYAEFRSNYLGILALAKRMQREAPERTQRRSVEEQKLSRIKTLLAQAVNMKKSLYESFVSELVSADEYISLRDDYAQRIDEMQIQAADIERGWRLFDEKSDSGYDLYTSLSGIKSKYDLTAPLIAAFVERIAVSADKSVRVILKDKVREVTEDA